MNELGFAVGEGPARRGVQVEGGEDLHQVLKLPAVGWKALVQTCAREKESKVTICTTPAVLCTHVHLYTP